MAVDLKELGTEVHHVFSLDLDEDIAQMLKEIGLNKIKDDDEALINYAVNEVLKEHLNLKEKENGD